MIDKSEERKFWSFVLFCHPPNLAAPKVYKDKIWRKKVGFMSPTSALCQP